ncbi:hypothetical protein C8R43DRAFT_959366 [Mycena crocata]|nr:hypothetical protein C8R43DRAFT_959366 [Mycena crocata]
MAFAFDLSEAKAGTAIGGILKWLDGTKDLDNVAGDVPKTEIVISLKAQKMFKEQPPHPLPFHPNFDSNTISSLFEFLQQINKPLDENEKRQTCNTTWCRSKAESDRVSDKGFGVRLVGTAGFATWLDKDSSGGWTWTKEKSVCGSTNFDRVCSDAHGPFSQQVLTNSSILIERSTNGGFLRNNILDWRCTPEASTGAVGRLVLLGNMQRAGPEFEIEV